MGRGHRTYGDMGGRNNFLNVFIRIMCVYKTENKILKNVCPSLLVWCHKKTQIRLEDEPWFSYAIAVARKDEAPWFSYISDGGAFPPESCVFGELLSLAAFFCKSTSVADIQESVTFSRNHGVSPPQSVHFPHARRGRH